MLVTIEAENVNIVAVQENNPMALATQNAEKGKPVVLMARHYLVRVDE